MCPMPFNQMSSNEELNLLPVFTTVSPPLQATSGKNFLTREPQWPLTLVIRDGRNSAHVKTDVK